MTNKNRAAIDLGSNSVLLTVLSETGDVLHDEARVVGLGRGIGDDGLIQPARMEAAIKALVDYTIVAATHGVESRDVLAIATSASRRARNSDEFYQRVLSEAGLIFKIISGDEEARLTYLGAIDGLIDDDEPVAVIDLGGGSTEVVQGVGGKIQSGISLELGSTRLTEDFIGHGKTDPIAYNKLKGRVAEVTDGLSVSARPKTVICVAGTATTLAAISIGLKSWDKSKVHGSTLTRQSLQLLIERLKIASKEERRQISEVSPERSDSLLAGATVIDKILDRLDANAAVVSVKGLRFGALSGQL